MRLADLETVVALARARQDLTQAAAVMVVITVSGPYATDADVNAVLVKAYGAELATRSGEVEARLAALGVEVA